MILRTLNETGTQRYKMKIKTGKIIIGTVMIATTALTSACVDGPFQQKIPETQWVVDDDGNKQKVSLHAKNHESSISLIRNNVADYYNDNFFSKKSIKDNEAILKELDISNRDKKKFSSALDNIYKVNPKIYNGIYFGDMNYQSKYRVFYLVTMGVLNSERGNELKIPANAVSVKGLNGNIDLEDVTRVGQYSLPEVDGKIPVFVINGEWKIDGIAIAKTQGFYKKA